MKMERLTFVIKHFTESFSACHLDLRRTGAVFASTPSPTCLLMSRPTVRVVESGSKVYLLSPKMRPRRIGAEGTTAETVDPPGGCLFSEQLLPRKGPGVEIC